MIENFFKALNGMLYKLAPQPVENFYLPDAPDVKAAKEEFLALFRNISRPQT